ncbi:pyruvate dehydrogenase E2 component (dihydrolipoamide acetyltransferase) [Brevibacterium sanguinis]|uniref:Dihydrolipoamide acetyltransferase component of pyruvate dehydrogenase complex n=2 Tax=Brevibacterium TaxID=1696 RepID=A0A366IHP7_9MICO|nr:MULTISPECIES: dihydrolipoamide acetyltransferase family protein [Brevibacterium]RBP65078.1 pyruvate dehydrogenase E2 component (dihydrolipoamide acetyltransferase) [Brevibacterium sanguinis]RBP71341.1 pyruvate dehydrogenase E2 component (dihydrolipoamide acetyltransferase) [Brevibacterium celere]
MSADPHRDDRDTEHSADTQGTERSGDARGTEQGRIREFHLPDLGEGLTEAELISWKVAVGDEVTVDQHVVEVESAKSVVELPSPFAGRIAGLHARPGDTVSAGQVLFSVAEADSAEASGGGSGEEVGASVADAAEGSGGRADAEARQANLIGYGTRERTGRSSRSRSFGSRTAGLSPVPDLPGEAPAQAPSGALPQDPSEAPAQDPTDTHGRDSASARVSPVISPIVRRLAKDHRLSAKHLHGSGPGGLVTRADVLAAIDERPGAASGAAREQAPGETPSGAQPDAVARERVPGETSPAAGTPADDHDTRTPLTGLRKVVAERLSRSRQEIPEATIWLDVDATELLATKRALEARTGEKYSLLSLVARFVVAGLKKHPILNSSVDVEAGEIVTHRDINLGLAAQTPRGLMVPVVHGAGDMSLRQLRDAVSETVGRASTGTFAPQELSGGTFTLNNYGVFGVDGSAPIINLPEVAMLGMGRIKERPWVVDGQLTVRQVMYLSFVFDHRVCDGAEPSAFLGFVADCIENPVSLLPEV